MSITLRDDQLARIEKLISQGAYADSTAVLDEALSLLEHRVNFRALVQEGIEAAERGEIVDHDTVMREVRKRIVEVAASQQTAASAAR